MNKLNVIKNASWIIVGRFVQAVLSLLVTMLTARYLGPSNYGILNYAISVTSFFIPVAILGINSVLVQELIEYPYQEEIIVGTSICMSFFTSILSCIGVFLFTLVANNGDVITIIVCCLYSLIMIFNALDLITYWYQSKLLSKYTSIVQLIGYIIMSTYKIMLLVLGTNVKWFALSYSLDYCFVAITLIIIYKRKTGNRIIIFSKDIAIRIFNKSKYYIVSTLMVTLFAQQDKVMLKLMLDNKATGIYSAAVTFTTMSGFIFNAIISSMRPVIYESKFKSKLTYENNITNLYTIIIYLCIAQGIIFTLFAESIIEIIYGQDYIQSSGVLQILIRYTSFSYIGGIRDIWILSEGKQRYLITINFMGALMNLILNYFLIKILGIYGAALSSLFTQIFTNIILTSLITPIKKNNKFVYESLRPKRAYAILLKTMNLIRQ